LKELLEKENLNIKPVAIINKGNFNLNDSLELIEIIFEKILRTLLFDSSFKETRFIINHAKKK
jgi:hypothetical protein